MKKSLLQLGLLLALLFSATAVFAQVREEVLLAQGARGPGAAREGHEHRPGQWLRHYKDMPEAQQQQELRRDPQFQQLPPERQQRLMDRLHQFNTMPPDQKERILNRMEAFEKLSPEKQQKLHELQHRVRDLPEDRQQAIHKTFRHLLELSPEERDKYMHSEQFRSSFNDEERGLLQQLIGVAPPANGNANGGPAPSQGPPKFWNPVHARHFFSWAKRSLKI